MQTAATATRVSAFRFAADYPDRRDHGAFGAADIRLRAKHPPILAGLSRDSDHAGVRSRREPIHFGTFRSVA